MSSQGKYTSIVEPTCIPSYMSVVVDTVHLSTRRDTAERIISLISDKVAKNDFRLHNGNQEMHVVLRMTEMIDIEHLDSEQKNCIIDLFSERSSTKNIADIRLCENMSKKEEQRSLLLCFACFLPSLVYMASLDIRGYKFVIVNK